MLPDNLPHFVTIKQSANVPDDIAADYDDPITVNEGETNEQVACWVQPAGKSEVLRFQRRDQNVTHTVYFRGNPNVRPGYILIPADGTVACPFAGATLEVKAVNETTAGLGVLWAVICEELQPR